MNIYIYTVHTYVCMLMEFPFVVQDFRLERADCSKKTLNLSFLCKLNEEASEEKYMGLSLETHNTLCITGGWLQRVAICSVVVNLCTRSYKHSDTDAVGPPACVILLHVKVYLLTSGLWIFVAGKERKLCPTCT